MTYGTTELAAGDWLTMPDPLPAEGVDPVITVVDWEVFAAGYTRN
jgi:hypothetical protein